MCDCIKRQESRLFAEMPPETMAGLKPNKASKLMSVRAKNVALNFSTGKCFHYFPFDFEWLMESGKTRATSVNMNISFCPFCGEKID